MKKNKMLVLRKKQIVALSLLILIGITGYLNWTFRNDAVDPDVAVMYQEASKKIGEAQMVSAEQKEEPAEPTEVPPKADTEYFTKARMDREVKRSESAELLSQILENPQADRESKKKAEEGIHQLAAYTEKEVNAENMIRAKGFGENIVFFTEEAANVAVESSGLNEIDAAQIQDIITSIADYSADQIKIVEIEPK